MEWLIGLLVLGLLWIGSVLAPKVTGEGYRAHGETAYEYAQLRFANTTGVAFALGQTATLVDFSDVTNKLGDTAADVEDTVVGTAITTLRNATGVSRLVCAESGLYRVLAKLAGQWDTTAETPTLEIKINGASQVPPLIATTKTLTGRLDIELEVESIVRLQNGDYVEMFGAGITTAGSLTTQLAQLLAQKVG